MRLGDKFSLGSVTATTGTAYAANRSLKKFCRQRMSNLLTMWWLTNFRLSSVDRDMQGITGQFPRGLTAMINSFLALLSLDY